jgi:hypothetical protein
MARSSEGSKSQLDYGIALMLMAVLYSSLDVCDQRSDPPKVPKTLATGPKSKTQTNVLKFRLFYII